MPKYANPTSYMGNKATTDKTGQVRFATEAETDAGTNDELAISPATLDYALGNLVPISGTSTLVAGTVTIANTSIATGDKIFLSRIDANASTTMGELSYTISNGVSFTVNSLILGTPGSVQTGDLSSFAYFVLRPV